VQHRLADRTQEQAGDAAAAAGSDDHELGLCAGRDQRFAGPGSHNGGLHGDIGVPAAPSGDGLGHDPRLLVRGKCRVVDGGQHVAGAARDGMLPGVQGEQRHVAQSGGLEGVTDGRVVGRRAVHADHDRPGGLGDASGDENRAIGVRRELHGHRPDQQAGESPQAPVADDEERGGAGLVKQHGRGCAGDDVAGNGRVGCLTASARYGVVDDAFCLVAQPSVGRSASRGTQSDVKQGPDEAVNHLQRSSAQGRFAGGQINRPEADL